MKMLRPLTAALPVLLVVALSGAAAAASLKAISDRTVTGLRFPESVAYDPNAKVLYVSEFGSELDPALMDGQGRISRRSLDGKVLDARFLPGNGQTLNKPKGIWVSGHRLWVTDIDGVWEFDTRTKKGRKVMLPGVAEGDYANDVTVMGGALYVSDNGGDQLFRVTPADFLDMQGNPQVTQVFSGKSINPNGLYPAGDGALLMVGYDPPDAPRGIYELTPDGQTKMLADRLGQLDGLYRLHDGSLLVTDWSSGSLDVWNKGMGLRNLAGGFDGPADFTVIPNDKGLLVIVPDLVKSQLRFIQLAK